MPAIPHAFPPDVRLYDVEGVPVTIGNVPGIELYCAAWDTDPPRSFPLDSAHRNGTPISNEEFWETVRSERHRKTEMNFSTLKLHLRGGSTDEQLQFFSEPPRVEYTRLIPDRIKSEIVKRSNKQISDIANKIIDILRCAAPYGIYEDTISRSVWDEYSWCLQEEFRTDSFDDVLEPLIRYEVECLSVGEQSFLNVLVFNEDDRREGESEDGAIFVDGIIALIEKKIKEQARHRNLDLIGPFRGEVLGYFINKEGVACRFISDYGDLMSVLVDHISSLINPDADLSDVADALVGAFMQAVEEENNSSVLCSLISSYPEQVRALVRETDVFPALEKMRTGLLEVLDR